MDYRKDGTVPGPIFETMRDELLNYDPEGDMVRLSDWEIGFLDDVRVQKLADFTGVPIAWSIGQREKMLEIWKKVFG